MLGRGKASMIALAALLSGGGAARAGDIALGEYLSSGCLTCHQKSGHVTGGVPAIVGWPAEQFTAVMQAYRSKERENEVMRAIASPLSNEDIAALAAYFGSLKPAH
jgi:cytochrome c553